ncbi:MAG: hypothetical protein IPJ98_24460 [Bryobacterales bacterium]|nr:hypothetical protein [Bryobacterales bacterium]
MQATWCAGRGAGVDAAGPGCAAARTCRVCGSIVAVERGGICAVGETAQAATVLLVVANVGIGIWIAMYLTMAQEVSVRAVSTAAGLLSGSGFARRGRRDVGGGTGDAADREFQWVFLRWERWRCWRQWQEQAVAQEK